MSTRLRRSETVDRNRELVLVAAREVFTERGYHEASLDQIAALAGFSKGVVYSQFESKADLFLALLERRIDERRAENLEAVRQHTTRRTRIERLIEVVSASERADPAWSLVVIEFRLHACRHRDLAARYVELHRRAVDGVAAVLAEAYERTGVTPPLPVSDLAAAVMTLGSGATIESALGSEVLPDATVRRVAMRLLTQPTSKEPR